MPSFLLDRIKASLRLHGRGALFFGPLILILLLLGYQCWSGYLAARREASITVANLADMLRLTIESSLERIRGDLEVFASTLDPADLTGNISADKRSLVERNMAHSLHDFDAVLNYRVFDAAGNSVLAAGRSNPHIQVSVGDRTWFQTLRDHPERAFVLSEVLISRSSGALGVVFAIPLRDASGSFLGVVNAYINLGWFQRLIDELNIGSEGLVTLRHREASRLLLRRPKVEAQLNESNTGLYHLHTSNLTQAEGEFVSAIDHLTRLYAFRGLEHFPLTVVVAVSPQYYLRSWYLQAGMTTLIALLLGVIQAVVYRRQTRSYHATLALAKELQNSNLNLQRSNAELEEFAYIASHDLQSPLRNIASFSQLLERRYKSQLGTEGAEFIDFIVSNATRMAGLIQDLLAYARVSRPEQPPQPIAARDVLDRVLTDLASPIAEAGASITIGALPTIKVSEHQLSSLFMNLLDNAIKYRHPDRPVEIMISAEQSQSGLWLFAIRDNGIGIAEEHWDKIFAIFQRLHTVDRYEGTGIGLALCRRIVHRWGGNIWVNAALEQGSIFYFTAPD